MFAAYVGTGQIASWPESVYWQFDFLERKAREEKNVEWLAEIEATGGPDPMNVEQCFALTRPLRRYLNQSDAVWLTGIVDQVDEADLETIGAGMRFPCRALIETQTPGAGAEGGTRESDGRRPRGLA